MRVVSSIFRAFEMLFISALCLLHSVSSLRLVVAYVLFQLSELLVQCLESSPCRQSSGVSPKAYKQLYGSSLQISPFPLISASTLWPESWLEFSYLLLCTLHYCTLIQGQGAGGQRKEKETGICPTHIGP